MRMEGGVNCYSLAFLGDVQEFLLVNQLALNSKLFLFILNLLLEYIDA